MTDHEEAYVHTYEGVAIVVCRQSAEGVFENGRYDIDESFRVTLVFGWNDGEWRPAGLHLSPILGRP